MSWGAPDARAAFGLARREWRRFFKDWVELIGGPAATTLLFLGAMLLAAETDPMPMGVPLAAYVAPGLIALAIGYNAFLHPGYVLVFLKLDGAIQDELLAPLSPAELVFGHAAPAAGAGLVTGMVSALIVAPFAPLAAAAPALILAFAILNAAFMAACGVIAGVLSRGWDGFSVISGLVILPLGFFSAVFFPLDALPPLAADALRWTPTHLAVDGLRGAMIERAAISAPLALAALAGWTALAWAVAWGVVARPRPLRD